MAYLCFMLRISCSSWFSAPLRSKDTDSLWELMCCSPTQDVAQEVLDRAQLVIAATVFTVSVWVRAMVGNWAYMYTQFFFKKE